MMLVATVVAEAMFWACLVLGCVFRYTLKMPRTGIVLLAATPVIDLLLLVFSYITLSQSGAAEFMHGFAAFYIAFSIVFGRSIIHAFDRKFSGSASKGVAVALLIAGIFVTGLKGSFWLVYWLIAVAFTPLMWWGVAKWYARKASKES